MDGLEAAIASLGLVAVILLLVLALCHRLGPRAGAWVKSEREEKIGLSKNQLFHANGYLIHQSGSDILLSSTGSFKRFESIDRDYVPVPPSPLAKISNGEAVASAKKAEALGQTQIWTATTITAPTAVSTAVTAADAAKLLPAVLLPVIPPQPLRPAPAPAMGTIERRRSERALKQRSCESSQHSTVTGTSTTAIPRPVARRQMSSPAAPALHPTTSNGSGSPKRMLINLSAARAEMCAGPRSATSNTNPFLNGSSTVVSALPKIDASEEVDKPSQPAASLFDFSSRRCSPDSPVRSWLIDETAAPNPSKNTNNPFIPVGTSASAAASMERLPIDGLDRSRRRFDDNFADAEDHSSETAATKVASNPIIPPLRFRSRSRSAAEIDDSHPVANAGLGRKMSAADIFIAQLSRAATPTPDRPMPQPNLITPTTSSATTTNPFRALELHRAGSLQKTLSETYLLEQWRGGYRSASQQWQSGKTLLQRQCSQLSLSSGITGGGRSGTGTATGYSSSNGSMSSLTSETPPVSSASGLASSGGGGLERSASCESLSSESSVQLGDLVQPLPLVTGQLCVGLHADRATQTPEGIELRVSVMQAKELIGAAPPPSSKHHRSSRAVPRDSQNEQMEPADERLLDTFVRLYVVPDERAASQTRLCRRSAEPVYNETFKFWLSRRRTRRSLWFHVYQQQQKLEGGGRVGGGGGGGTALVGEVELPLLAEEARLEWPTTRWLQLSDAKRQRSEWGDLMFSISYLPTAERLTVVVVKGRNLVALAAEEGSRAVENVFVKVYLLKDQKKVSKRKTTVKRSDNCPIYNESMIFNVPPYQMHNVQLRLTVWNSTSSGHSSGSALGHVIVGAKSGGKGMRHWNQMLASLRKPIAMWHPIRQTK